MGEMRHMSMRPEPRYWPSEQKRVNRGMPKQKESNKNCKRKTTEKIKKNINK
jgi:hypothetical protein